MTWQRCTILSLLAAAAFLAGAASASAHPERRAHFPDANTGSVPRYRTSGPSRVVCKNDTRARINSTWNGKGRKVRKVRHGREKSLALLARCRYHNIQA